MRRSLFAVVAIVVIPIATTACAGALASGEADFKKGKYAEAKTELVGAEGESRGWNESKRAEYALYRGLTHAALGDRAAASTWLAKAKAIEDARPGTLSLDDMARLKLALDATNPSELPASP